MISEDYDHRWEALAEVHFHTNDEFSDENYLYCLCSRVFIRDGVKLYFVEKEEFSESEVEVLRDSKSQGLEDESHVHFSADTSDKTKCERDEGASCYCSASHTDNYCSTDEHDPAQGHGTVINALQPSDSGADLTYQECHLDYNTIESTERMDQDILVQNTSAENYMTESTWEKFWAVNGERIIWASWIKTYSDCINPAYLDENNDLMMDENNTPKERGEEINTEVKEIKEIKDDNIDIRERKFSYDSKVNPYKNSSTTKTILEKTDKSSEAICNKDDTWLPISRIRSCSEHDRMLSPRTLATSDSMTNVTKMTLSSYDVTSSHVTSESTPTDDYSVSSSTSDDQSNDQTRIANIDDNAEYPEEMDTDQYWQFLWKKHFGEQYALHYANYIECHNKENEGKLTAVTNIDNDIIKEKTDIEFENSDGNSQEMPTVIEVQSQVDKIKITEKTRERPKKKNKKDSNKYIGSVGILLQNLLKEEQKRSEVEGVLEAGDESSDKKDIPTSTDNVDEGPPSEVTNTANSANDVYKCCDDNDDGDGDDPQEQRQILLKRSHELDLEAIESQKVRSTFEQMGLPFEWSAPLRGQLVYRKRVLRPPTLRHKRAAPRKTYFDDDGNPIQAEQLRHSNDEREMQTDEDCSEVKSEYDRSSENINSAIRKTSNLASDDTDNNGEGKEVEAISVPLPTDLDTSFSDVQENADQKSAGEEAILENTENTGADNSKRRRRKRRRSPEDVEAEMPVELLQHPNMKKYWRKRHSLFNRFDQGIRLDVESWFSATPERVARRTAERCRCDLLLDAFCGAAGNAIQFAFTCERVIAIDIDPAKISLARHNAAVYGVADRIEFVVGDFFALAPTLKADVVFLSPPWGGPDYAENSQYDLETMLAPRPASQLMAAAQQVSHNVALYVPRNSRSDQLVSLAKYSGAVEIEQNFLGRRFVALTAYYGDLVNCTEEL